MAEKEKKKEEKEKTPEDVAFDNLKADAFRETAGLNLIRKQRGDFGDLLYRTGEDRSYALTSSNEANGVRTGLLNAKRADAQRNGYAGQVDVSNSDVAYGMYVTVQRSLQQARVGDLEKLALDNGAKLDFKVPESLRGISKAQVLEVAEKSGALKDGKLDPSKLDKKYRDAFALCEALGDAYETAAAMSFNRYVDLYGQVNEIGKKVAEGYKK